MMIKNLFQHRSYLFGSIWSDFRFRYSGTMFGFYWFVLGPILDAVLYSIIFSFLIDIRSNGSRGDSYVLFLLSGLFPWFAFTNLVVRGSNVLNSSKVYLRRLSISTDVFVAREGLIAFISLFIYILILLLVNLVLGNSLSWYTIIIPILILLFVALGFGITLALAHLRVFFPDLGEVLGMLVHLWRWTLPINYAFDKFPDNVSSILKWNPPYYFISAFHDVLFYHRLPAIETWIYMLLWIIVFGFIGTFISNKLAEDVKDQS